MSPKKVVRRTGESAADKSYRNQHGRSKTLSSFADDRQSPEPNDTRQTITQSPYNRHYQVTVGSKLRQTQKPRPPPPSALSKAVTDASKQAIDSIFPQAPRRKLQHDLTHETFQSLAKPSESKCLQGEVPPEQPAGSTVSDKAYPTAGSLGAKRQDQATAENIMTSSVPNRAFPKQGSSECGSSPIPDAVSPQVAPAPEFPMPPREAQSSAPAPQQLGGGAPDLSSHQEAGLQRSPRSAALKSSPRSRDSGIPFDVYEALKRQQPAEVQQQIELEEVYWNAKELQDRRKELQQQLRDDEMLARIKRRMAGEKLSIPSINLPEFVTKLLTPRGTSSNPATARSTRSSQPVTARSEGGRPNLLDPSEPSFGPVQTAAPVGNRPSAAAAVSAAVAAQGPPTMQGSAAARLSAGRAGHVDGRTSGALPGGADARDSWMAYYQGVDPARASWRGKAQQRVAALVNHPDFGLGVTLLIALNCAALALYEPQVSDHGGRNPTLNKLEMAINFAFTVEVILTCIAAGGVKEYLRSPWNIFDLSMVLVGYTDFIPSGGEQAGGVRALRALRALRPLRTITRFESLRSIVVCFLEAVPLLLTVMQLLLFFIVLAAITGTLLFMESFRLACFEDNSGLQESSFGLKDYGCGSRACPENYTCQEFTPKQPFTAAGFGHVGESMLSVFQVITLNGWAYIMYTVMDTVGPASFIFFVVVVLLQAYFVINLFLAVLKNKFAKAQELYSKASFEEDKPRSTFALLWRKIQERLQAYSAHRRQRDEMRMVERSNKGHTGFSIPSSIQESQEMQERRPSLQIPQTRLQWFQYRASSYWFEFRWHLRQVVEHPLFDYVFIACILASTVLLAMTTAEMSPGYAAAIDTGSRVFTVVFAVEATAKIIGLGLWGFMADRFNVFDVIVVVLGIVEMVIAMGSSGTALRSFKTLRIMRSLRVLRVLRVFRHLQSLRVITDVLLSSMGAFLAIAGLMTLFIFVFATVGLQTFGHYDLAPEFPNFHNVWHAIILVFQTLTLENWAQLMFSVQAAGGWATTLFFVVWVALGKWTLLTLFLAITLSAFEANYEKYNRGSSGGGKSVPARLYHAVRQFLRGKLLRRHGRVAPTLSFTSMRSFNSASSAQSAQQLEAKPPGRKLQRKPTGFARASPGYGLSPTSTTDEQALDGQGGDAAEARLAAKLQVLGAKRGRSPSEFKLAVSGGAAKEQEGEEGTSGAAPVVAQKLAVGLLSSPADFSLTLASATDEQEIPVAPGSSAAQSYGAARLGATSAPSPGPPNVILTIGRGTDDSEAPSGHSPMGPVPLSPPSLPSPGGGPPAPRSSPIKGLIGAFHAPSRVLANLREGVHRPQAPGASLAGDGPRGHARLGLGGRPLLPHSGAGGAAPGVPDGGGGEGGVVTAGGSPALHRSITLPKGHVVSLVQQFEGCSPKRAPGNAACRPGAAAGCHPLEHASTVQQQTVQPPLRALRRSCSAPLPPLRSAMAGVRTAKAAAAAAAAFTGRDTGDSDDDVSVRSEGDVRSDDLATGTEPVGGRRARSRRARFALPEEAEAQDAACATAGVEHVQAPLVARRALRSSITPKPPPTVGSPAGDATLQRSPSTLSGKSNNTSDSDSEASFTHGGATGGARQAGRLNRSSGRLRRFGRLNSSSTAASDQCDDTTIGSELSGTSSTFGRAGRLRRGTTFNRLTSGARKRSKRQDFPVLMGRSMFLFEADSLLRNKVYDMVTLRYFDYFMMSVVLLSCVQMALETPSMDPEATRTIILKWVDIGTTIVFWVEVILKSIAFSFKAYISYFTNKVDFGVAVISTIVLIAESVNARFLKAFRAARAIKPLRILTRSVSMLLVFNTLTRSLMEMGNVTVLCALCFLIFAILGVQLFAGLFWSCTDPAVAGKEECVGTYVGGEGQEVSRMWRNLHFNFDDIGNAFLTLFITATLDGYTPAMYMSMSTRAEPGLQPQLGSNSAAFLYWFAYITLVAFFVLNLYVGVVFYQFQRLKMMSQTGSAVLTASQTGYVEMMKAVFRLKPLDKAPLPHSFVRRLCHLLAYSRWFGNSMTLVIVANILLLATTYNGEPEPFAAAKEHANTAFSGLVILECLIKVIAMGPKLYCRSSWNKFDLALCLAAILDILTQILNAVLGDVVDLSTIKKGMMLLRTLRMFKLMRKFKGIQSLMTTLFISLPAIVNVGALLLLFFFIYAYMGVMLFGNVKLQASLNSHANFKNFPSAMLVLFRVATGDDWAGIMQDCMIQSPDCDDELGDCGSIYVWVYFMSFYLAVGLIAFNLFTTVILETFERIQDTELWRITPANLDEFCELWAEFDDGTSLIDPKHLEHILMRMRPPMGLGSKATGTDVVRFVFALDIPLVDGKVPFYRTAFELVKKGAHAEIPPGELKSKMDRMIRRFLQKHQTEEEENMSFSVACTVVRIQRHWRGLVAKRREEAESEAARAARHAAGVPSEEEAAPEFEKTAAPEQRRRSVLGVVRRASVALANIRVSMKRSRKFPSDNPPQEPRPSGAKSTRPSSVAPLLCALGRSESEFLPEDAAEPQDAVSEFEDSIRFFQFKGHQTKSYAA